MAISEFDEFIRRQNEKKRELGALDIEKELREWRECLKNLYGSIEKYMAAYVESGQAKIDYKSIQLNEEFSGPYEVDQMSLSIGPSVVLFKPVGTMLIGAKGRVDVQGAHGSARLVLVSHKVEKAQQLIDISISFSGAETVPAGKRDHDSIQWVWKLATPAPNMRFIDLDEQTFFNMVLSVGDA